MRLLDDNLQALGEQLQQLVADEFIPSVRLPAAAPAPPSVPQPQPASA